MHLPIFCSISLLATTTVAYDNLLRFNTSPQVETRSIEQIYKAASKKGRVVTAWTGGDEKNQQDALKTAFEKSFPGMKLNLTVDLSKYYEGTIDEQLANGKVYAAEGKGASRVSGLLATGIQGEAGLTYPNDDDAILFAFDLILKKYGTSWFNKLLQQKPRWVRGSATGPALVANPNTTYVATFTSGLGLLKPQGQLNATFSKQGQLVEWPQTAAILKDAPHPEGAKLLHNSLLSNDFQKQSGFWSVRFDVPVPVGYPKFIEMPGTNPSAFSRLMEDRTRVKRLRFWFEMRLGTAQGLSLLDDDL